MHCETQVSFHGIKDNATSLTLGIIVDFIIPRFIVDDLTKSYSVLKDAASAEAEEIAEEEITDAEGELKNNKITGSNIQGTEGNEEKPQDVQPTHEAYASVVFDLSVIAEIATYKSSVVGVSWSKVFIPLLLPFEC